MKALTFIENILLLLDGLLLSSTCHIDVGKNWKCVGCVSTPRVVTVQGSENVWFVQRMEASNMLRYVWERNHVKLYSTLLKKS